FASLHRLHHAESLRPWLAGQVVQAVGRAIRRKHLLARLGFEVIASPHFDAMLREAPPEIADELDRLYALADRLPMKLRMALLLGVGAALLAAAIAFVLVLLFSPASEQAAAGGRADPRLDDGRHQLELPDGSRVWFGAEAAVRALSFVADDVELQLLRGMAEL